MTSAPRGAVGAGDALAAIDARLRAIAADLAEAREQIGGFDAADLARVEAAVTDVEGMATSLRSRLEWIRWRSGQPADGRS